MTQINKTQHVSFQSGGNKILEFNEFMAGDRKKWKIYSNKKFVHFETMTCDQNLVQI